MVWMPLQRRSGIFTQFLVGVWVLAAIAGGIWLLQRRDVPQMMQWGVSFSKLHSEELGLNWREVYLAILDDLGANELRLSAHWPMIEPERDVYNFTELDFQMNEARARGAHVILAVGRKSPGWPECHTPHWVGYMGWEEQQMEIKQYVTEVVERYREYPNIRYWQVENEPFLNFARHICGDPDEDFFKEEVALVRAIDPGTPILTTDGGEFGLWYKAHEYADAFGSTMYLYVYTKHIGYWRYPVYGGFFRFKLNMLEMIAGPLKPAVSIEVGLEPWLNQPIVQTTIEEQLEKMNMERFEKILAVARASGFSAHYLWGAEWWYYIKQKGHPEFWERAKQLFK